MTRKHYKLIAEALRNTKPCVWEWKGSGYYAAVTTVWERACREVANALCETSPRFDRNRFLDACGVEDASDAPCATLYDWKDAHE